MLPSVDVNNSLPVYSVVGDRYTYLLTGAQTAGGCFMFEAFVPSGNGPPPHVHSREDEAFYVVEGDFDFTVSGKPSRMSAGGFLVAQRGMPHNFKNVGSSPGKLIITCTPAGLEDFFSEIGSKLASRDDAPIQPSAEDIAKLVQVAAKFGLKVLTGH
jgi:quercetin dioxygenase-like cupin family protein